MKGKIDLTVRKIPTDEKNKHPDPPAPVLPRHEFTMGLIAPKGAGKTTLICNLLLFYKKYFHQIIVFSPSIKSDEKWDFIKKQDLLAENKPLKKFIADMAKERLRKDSVVSEAPKDMEIKGYDHRTQEFDPKIPEENFIADYTPDKLFDIIENQLSVVEFLKEEGQTKYLADRVLIIFDDLVGSELLRRNATNPFKKFSTNHRHMSISALCVSQAYKELPKTVRSNFTCMIIFKVTNDAELQVIYEENTVGFTQKEWLKVYNDCIEDEHGFMFFNQQSSQGCLVMKNFDEIYTVAK